MNHHRDDKLQHPAEENTKGRPRLDWRFKVFFLSVMGVLGLFGHAFNGLGGAGAVALAALVVPIYGYCEFWNQGRFWIVVAILAVIQVPLVIVVRRWAEQGAIRSMLPLGIADGMFVIVVIFLVCSRSGGESRRS